MLVGLLLFTPLFASAQTVNNQPLIDALEALVKVLMQEIAAIQATQQTNQPVFGSTAPDLVPILTATTTIPTFPVPTCTLTIATSTVTQGINKDLAQVDLSWTTQNATEGYIYQWKGQDAGVPIPGHKTILKPIDNGQILDFAEVNPNNATFEAEVTGDGGDGTCTATI